MISNISSSCLYSPIDLGMSPSSGFPHRLLPISCRSEAPFLSWRCYSDDIAQSNHIVAGLCEQQLKASPLFATEFGLSYRANLFTAAKDLFGPLSGPPTHLITRATPREPVNRGTPAGVVLHHMQGGPEFEQIVNEIPLL